MAGEFLKSAKEGIKKNCSKKLHNSGKSYINIKGNLVEGKIPGY